AFTDDSVSAIRSQASRPGAHGRSRAIPATAVAALMLLNLPALAQQDADNETETVDGLMWSLVTNGESVPWNPANEFCETLEHAGFVDWRLPTLQELETLHDASAENGMRAPFAIDD